MAIHGKFYLINFMPKLPEQNDDRKKLTVRKIILALLSNGFSGSRLARMLGVSKSLISKYKLTPKEAREKRYKYYRTTGNTPKYRQKQKLVLKDKILKYRRFWRKNNRDRKNKYTPRYSTRKYEKTY